MPRPCATPWLAACLTLFLAACATAPSPATPSPTATTATAVAAPGPTAPADELAAALDAVLREAYPADQPGAAAIVVRDGVVLLRGGYGMADLELGVPLRPEHVFRLGSITKQFTGVAILMLAAEGKLSLDDPLTRFFPDYPTGGRTVTVEHLLGHTSGIRSYTSMPEWAPTRRQDLSVDELIALFRDQPFDFEPGDAWSYNNSGYILLGAIIEQLSGTSYGEFVETRIFRPLGMTASFYGDAAPVIPDRVPGYSRSSGAWVNSAYLSMTHPYAAGSLLSTVDDLARWDQAITQGRLLDPDAWDRAFTPVRLNDGRSTRYAIGWGTGRIGPYSTIEHGGGINGFSTNAIRVPDAGLFVAVLANADNPVTSPSQVSLRLADLALGGAMDEPAIDVPEARLRDYVGYYRIDDDAARTITLEDGRLYSQRTGGNRFELRPVADDLFLFPDSGSRIRFLRGGEGQVIAMVLEPRLGMAERAERLPGGEPPARQAIVLPSESLAAYPGTYRLTPGFDLVITRDGDQLFAQGTGQQPIPILPESATRFFATAVNAVIEFAFEDGRVTGLTLHQGGRSHPAPRVD